MGMSLNLWGSGNIEKEVTNGCSGSFPRRCIGVQVWRMTWGSSDLENNKMFQLGRGKYLKLKKIWSLMMSPIWMPGTFQKVASSTVSPSPFSNKIAWESPEGSCENVDPGFGRWWCFVILTCYTCCWSADFTLRSKDTGHGRPAVLLKEHQLCHHLPFDMWSRRWLLSFHQYLIFFYTFFL